VHPRGVPGLADVPGVRELILTLTVYLADSSSSPPGPPPEPTGPHVAHHTTGDKVRVKVWGWSSNICKIVGEPVDHLVELKNP
jgi:hypothetical protein